jgi:DNA-directed RNA polymerase subunit beta'
MYGHSNAQLTELAMKNIREEQGFNSVYDAWFWSKGSKEQIRQLTGMRGLMAKPKMLVVVKLLKIQFFLTLKKVFLFLSTLFLLTVS